VVPAGSIATVNKDVGAGAGDGVPVSQATFDTSQGLVWTSQGLFIVDSKKGPTVPTGFNGKRTGLLRFVNTTAATVTLYPQAATPISVPPGYIVTVAGGSTDQTSVGNGNFALNAKLLAPTDVAVSPLTGDIYISTAEVATGDVPKGVVRKISRSTGIITNVNGLSTAQYAGLAFDADGRLYAADYRNHRVYRESSAGSGTFARMDVGAGVNKPRDVAVDAAGNAYVTNSGDHRILKITPAGAVTAIAGSSQGFSGDPGLATSAQLNITPPVVNIGSSTTPTSVPLTVGIVVGTGGEILFADSNNHRIRRIR
jgi:hypothetical protein